MWRRCAFWCRFLILLSSGCATSQSSSISWLERFRPFQGPSGPDVVQIDVSVLQRPLTDAYLTRDLWTNADEQAVSLENKIILEQNGFRVGQVGGLTPAGLQELLVSKKSSMDSYPRRLYIRANNPTPVTLGPKIAACHFQIEHGGQSEILSLDQAECQVSVVPIFGKDGTIKLRFTPQIQHGTRTLQAKTTEDQSGFLFQTERPIRTFADLSWEVTMPANQYVVIGGRFDRPDTLGCRCFLRGDEARPVQRLLVMRASRGGAAPAEDSVASTDEVQPMKTPPLALQAAWTSARGSAN